MESIVPKIIFYFFAGLMIATAVIVVYGKNLVHSAFSLLGTFFSVAVMYVLLGADFLAGAQLLIYVGGILTLLLFGVMLTNRIYDLNLKTGTFQVVPGVAVAVSVFVILLSIIYKTPWHQMALTDSGGSTEEVGRLLMTDYVLPFEIASVLLLVALMGAAMLVRRGSGT